jgi:hypothetical protein
MDEARDSDFTERLHIGLEVSVMAQQTERLIDRRHYLNEVGYAPES